ncbi:MAG: ATP-binding protein [Pseudomonadota bacterium]
MSESKNSPSKFELLKQQAEVLIRQKPDLASEFPSDILELIHELKIHQVELEIQNEELKRSQHELSELHRDFQNLYEFAPCGYVTLNPKGIITRANLTAVSLLQTIRQFLSGSGFSQYIAAGWNDIYIDARQKAIKAGKQSVELQMKNKNKIPLWVLAEIEADKDVTGAVLQWRIVLMDISEQKKAAEAIQRSEAKYRNMIESMTDAVYVCSPDHAIEFMNSTMIKRLGRDATGETCYRAMHGMDRPCDWCPFERVRNGETIDENTVSPLDNLTYRLTHMPVLNDDQTISKLTIYRDITDYLNAVAEKEKAQAKLIQAQKMESIGTLAGGIAHDFNNILYPIIGFAELSIEDLPEVHPIKENLEDILQGAKRARDLVKQILAFSSQREEKLKLLPLAPLIQEALKLLRATIPSNIDIQQELYSTSDCVLANPIGIHEIIMNLCTNAYHAMEKTGGILSIHLNKAEPNPKLNLPHGDFCCLSISDTGIGIPPEIINKVFEPYFTTKELGKGSGLGLSVVHGIIKKYHGEISVESKPGKGTIFNIYLPVTSATKTSEEASGDRANPGGNENILFVDDEIPIVKLGIRLLERIGYKVTGRNSSVEALALFKSAPDDFDLVITDMTMPEMVGTDFAAKLMEIRPDIPVILCTGFSENVNFETSPQFGLRGYIHKPILSADLYSEVRQVLDQGKKDKFD